MGPRLRSRGIENLYTVLDGLHTLQWGRGFAAAESPSPSLSRCARRLALQWGRGFAAAESCRSMLAAIRQIKLQWGRGFAAAESPIPAKE